MRYDWWSPTLSVTLVITLVAGAALVEACASRGGGTALLTDGRPVPIGRASVSTRAAVSDSMAELVAVPTATIDSAKSREQPNCKAPLTGLLHSVRDDAGRRRWHVRWPRIMSHIATLRVESDSGEKDHVLQPVRMNENGDTIKASIASIKGTELLSEEASVEALRCGRVIAVVESNGDHAETEIKEGTNYLVIALQPMSPLEAARWVFVILNRGRNYRGSLNTFKYTPHATGYTTPQFSGTGRNIRTSLRQRPLSVAAQDCFARGWKACFIDPHGSEGDMEDQRRHGPSAPELTAIQGGSQPWVPCPLYGCCCGGDACHDDR